jgi:asparagine synthase (glutamine-hydrolysing)
VKEALPGYCIVVNTERNQFNTQEYWRLPPTSYPKKEKVDYVSEFLDKFRNATEKMLPEQTPFAISLSGGLDSASVAFVANELARTQCAGRPLLITAVSRSPSEEKTRMLSFIRDCERFWRSEIRSLYLPDSLDWTDVKDMIVQLEEPFPLLESYLYWCIARELKQDGIRVAFTGTAADVFLWGDYIDQVNYLKDLWHKRNVRTLLSEIVGLTKASQGARTPLRSLIELVKNVVIPSRTASQNSQFLSPPYVAKSTIKPHESPLDTAAKEVVEMTNALNKLFSTFSVEVRIPFLDQELVNFMNSLPPSEKIRKGVKKLILRTAMKGAIPESIRMSMRKFDTSIPLVEWLTSLRSEINELLLSKTFRERQIFDQERILGTYNSLCEGKLDSIEARKFASLLWRIINLELWFRIYIDPSNQTCAV